MFEISSVLRRRLLSSEGDYDSYAKVLGQVYNGSDDELPYQKFTIEIGYQYRDSSGALVSNYASQTTSVIAAPYQWRELNMNPNITDFGFAGNKEPTSAAYKTFAELMRPTNINTKPLTSKAVTPSTPAGAAVAFNDGMTDGFPVVAFYHNDPGGSTDKVLFRWQPSSGGAVASTEITLASRFSSGEQDYRYLIYINLSQYALLSDGNSILAGAATNGFDWISAQLVSSTNSSLGPKVMMDMKLGALDQECLKYGKQSLIFINAWGVPEYILLNAVREYSVDLSKRKYSRKPLLNYKEVSATQVPSYGHQHASDIYSGEYVQRITCETASGLSDDQRRKVESLLMTRRAWLTDSSFGQDHLVPVKVISKAIKQRFRTQSQSNYVIELEVDRYKQYA